MVRRFDDAVDHYFARTCAGFLRYIGVLLFWLAGLLDGQVAPQPPEIDIDILDGDPIVAAVTLHTAVDLPMPAPLEPLEPLVQPEPEPADTANRDIEMLTYGKYAGRTFAYVFSHDLGNRRWTVNNRRPESTIALRRFADYCCDKGGFPRRWHEDTGPGYRDYSYPDPRSVR